MTPASYAGFKAGAATFSANVIIDAGSGAAGSLSANLQLGRGTSNRFYISTIRAGASNDADGLAFLFGSTERMRINSGGNVGIGTAAPTAKLESSGSAAGSVFKALSLANDGRPSSTLTGTGVSLYFSTAA